ncbi:MAG: hypothetical protein V3W24_01985 [Gemmatimonadota bacterium]
MTLFWALMVVVLILLIPLLAIVIDSQIGQALARRISREPPPGELEARVDALEGELRYLTESVEGLREESVFIRALVEGRGEPRDALPPGGQGAARESGD